MVSITNLPSIVNARLPEAYQAAKQQLAACATVDECKTWADKAAALASYAKQSQDEALVRLALKIQARATKRCGELLKEIEPQKGGDRRSKGRRPPVDRTSVARSAGLSSHQQKTALRVANVPKDEFEAAVERPGRPATVTELAERGTKKKPRPLLDLRGRSPEDFKAATAAQVGISQIAKVAASILPSDVVRGTMDAERAGVLKDCRASVKWLEKLITQMERKIG